MKTINEKLYMKKLCGELVGTIRGIKPTSSHCHPYDYKKEKR
jgi:hypothetical protein